MNSYDMAEQGEIGLRGGQGNGAMRQIWQ